VQNLGKLHHNQIQEKLHNHFKLQEKTVPTSPSNIKAQQILQKQMQIALLSNLNIMLGTLE
jgi:hypothetical protein